MLAFEQLSGSTQLSATRRSAGEYLLTRRLLYRATTGERIGPFVAEFVYPNRHRYSALAALDYFRDAALTDGTAPDPRLADAVELVRAARQPDGTWLQGAALPGRTWFDVDAPEGQPSRWLTLIGSRVLRWWDEAT
jgi:hypothetical protein